MSLASLCNSTADVQRSTNSTDASGGITKSWAMAYSAILVSVQPANGRIIKERSRPEMEIDTVIYTPTTVSLRFGDRVVSNSIKYLVQSFADQAGRGSVFAAYCKRLDQ